MAIEDLNKEKAELKKENKALRELAELYRILCGRCYDNCTIEHNKDIREARSKMGHGQVFTMTLKEKVDE